MKKEYIESILKNIEKQHGDMSNKRRRFQAPNHSFELARLEGQIYILNFILMQWSVGDDQQNIIEQ